MKCVNIKLWDLLGCFHYILNAPRNIELYPLVDWGICMEEAECNQKRKCKILTVFSLFIIEF